MSQCHSCATGQVEDQIRSNFKVVLGGKKRNVSRAKIRVCNNCGAETWPPKELHRWSKLPEWVSKKKSLSQTHS